MLRNNTDEAALNAIFSGDDLRFAVGQEDVFSEDVSPEEVTVRISHFIKEGNLNAAFSEATVALEKSPRCAELWHLRGYAQFQLGDIETAIGDFSEAIEITPDFAAARCNRAFAFLKLNDHRRAFEDANLAVKAMPSLRWPLTGNARLQTSRAKMSRFLTSKFGGSNLAPVVQPQRVSNAPHEQPKPNIQHSLGCGFNI